MGSKVSQNEIDQIRQHTWQQRVYVSSNSKRNSKR